MLCKALETYAERFGRFSSSICWHVRASGSGKPSKRMLAEIRDWDPSFNLQRASQEQRMNWRRAYTINWVYDLVNLFSSIVVQRNTMKSQIWKCELIDWSENGAWNKHRRLYGLNEFAGELTTFAMQKSGSKVPTKGHAPYSSPTLLYRQFPDRLPWLVAECPERTYSWPASICSS